MAAALGCRGKPKRELDLHTPSPPLDRDRIGYAYVEQVDTMPGRPEQPSSGLKQSRDASI